MPAITNLVVLLSAAATAFGTVHHVRANHGSIARRMENNEARSENETNLSKRFFSPRVTWYPTNTGADACTGRNHGDYDNIVALNIPQWGNLNSRSSACGKKIRIHANGKTEIGVIQDACASCFNWGEIDLTLGLFKKFYPESKGVFEATWEFIGDDDDNDPPPPPPVKKPVKKPDPKPTKHVEEKPSKPKTTSTHSKKKTHKSSSTKSSSSTSSTSTPVVPPIATPTPPTPPSEDSDVGNAGADPSADSSLSGGISSGLGSDNGAAGVTINKFVAGAAALILAIHAL